MPAPLGRSSLQFEICTDGAPAKKERKEFTTVSPHSEKTHVAQHFDNQHQENLCAKALQMNSDVVETVTQDTSVVEWQHRHLFV